MGDCCKQICKLVMNDQPVVLMVLILAQSCAYISSHLYFYVFAIELTKCKSHNEKEIMSCKSLSHILVFDQEKKKVIFVLKCSKSQRLTLNVEISKISSTNLKKRCSIQKGANVMIFAKAKWKASKFCNHSFVGSHICSFL